MHFMLSSPRRQTLNGKLRGRTILSSLDFAVWLLLLQLSDAFNPHAPQRLTWQVISQTGDVIWSISKDAPPWSWWPPLYPDLCQLAAGLETWDIPEVGPRESTPVCLSGSCPCPSKGIEGKNLGCSHPQLRAELRKHDIYVCPRNGRDRSTAVKCGGAEQYFCKSWGCETTGTTYWKPQSNWDAITLNRASPYEKETPGLQKSHCSGSEASGHCLRPFSPGGHRCKPEVWTGQGPCLSFTCNPLNITFTGPGKKARDWIKGRQWGLRLYMSGRDAGLLMTIRLKIESCTSLPIGPNPVLAEQGPLAPLPPHLQKPVPGPTTVNVVPEPPSISTGAHKGMHHQPPVETGQRLFNLVQGAFQVLNVTNPEATSSCWLCLSSGPPYYEGLALTGTFNISDHSEGQCSWWSQNKLTLTEVFGRGLCIGKVPPTHQHLCNSSVTLNQTEINKYLVPGDNLWWACNTGLTPCVSTMAFDQSKHFCVMVQLVPRIYYHPEEVVIDEYDYRPTRLKREPVSLTLAVLLGLRVTAGVGTGTAALITGPQQLERGLGELHAVITEDLQALEKSVSNLEESLTSLSELVLQNQRDLGLLFLKEGGLCAALKEECCFYVDHSGAIRDSMSKLRERLGKRHREREANQGWFEGWFNKSPWMTTLLSSLMGPLIVLLLMLTIGPCIINKLIAFIRERVSAVQVMVLRQQYRGLPRQEETDI
uniref:TIMELESS-interacting protein isoform X1 n=1 Tax=Jaculus jaculus TaxID=51337 RepID=UPI001E1B4E57|nr:TIMELESS-interacting protein isoform X1 [Jaculus jaculus]XP_045016609.1 TIMELESS-interacting protein isoform X1 [Jaculus jaculus]XP_045016611.1 TIMELESS-interacting protein isoform X1 [Jaculus jaculus]